MEDAVLDFSFDTSGQFMLTQVYLLGAAMQIDRYQTAVAQKKHSKITGLFMQFHEISCLLEDLDSIRRYFMLGGFEHKNNSLWQTARDHIRHDVRDLATNPNDVKRKRTRHENLSMDERLVSQMVFESDKFIIGKIDIEIQDIKDYLDWANTIFDKYIDYSRSTGQLKNK